MLLKKSLSRVMITLLAIAALLLFSGIAFAQTDTGRIAGTVTDQNGAIVPGATVVVKNEKTGEERTATSTGDGLFIGGAGAAGQRLTEC